MGSKVVFVVGLLALIAGVGFFFMTPKNAGGLEGTMRPEASDSEELRMQISSLNNKNAELTAEIEGLKEQLKGAYNDSKSAVEEKTTGTGKQGKSVHKLTPAEKTYEKFRNNLSNYAKMVAKIIKAEKEGTGPGNFMNDPDMLAFQADMLRFAADLQKEFGISMMYGGGGEMLMLSFLLEPVCQEIGVPLSDAQKSMLESETLQLIEGLMKAKDSSDMLEIEKSYERMALMRGYTNEFADFLTEEQKKELGEFGSFGERRGMSEMRWSLNMISPADDANEQAGNWQRAFGIDDQQASAELNGIARDYLASYSNLQNRYGLGGSRFEGQRQLTDDEKKQVEREMLKIEVDALKKISQLKLTEDQKKRVLNYDPFNSMGLMSRNLHESKVAANEAGAISRLRTLSSAQELYNTRYDKYAETLYELQERNMISDDFEQSYDYTFEIISATKGAWSASATPKDWSGRHFFMDQTGVIYYEVGRPANDTSKPLGS